MHGSLLQVASILTSYCFPSFLFEAMNIEIVKAWLMATELLLLYDCVFLTCRHIKHFLCSSWSQERYDFVWFSINFNSFRLLKMGCVDMYIVYAIEASEMAQQTQLIVNSNHMKDRIVVVHGKVEVNTITVYCEVFFLLLHRSQSEIQPRCGFELTWAALFWALNHGSLIWIQSDRLRRSSRPS